MAVKGSCSVTVSRVVDVSAIYRYYLLTSSMTKPVIDDETVRPPTTGGVAWGLSEPAYQGGTYYLYFTDCAVLSSSEISYSEVSLSSSYEAAKAAYNLANNAQGTANTAKNTADAVQATATAIAADLTANYTNNTNLVKNFYGKEELGQTLSFSPNDGLTIKVPGSLYKMVISNQQISFIYDTDPIAYINGEAMAIPRALMLDEIMIGGSLEGGIVSDKKWSWKLESDDSLSLTWLGE